MKKHAGVYAIVNLINNKMYIGSTTRSLRIRWYGHKCDLKRNKHSNRHLQSAWNKYGSKNFVFKILDECRIDDCTDCEQMWIDKFRSINKSMVYNIRKFAENNTGFKHSEKSRIKMSKAQIGRKLSPERKAKISGWKHTPQARLKISKAGIGRKHTKEAIAKMSKRFKGKPLSAEHRANLSKAQRGRKHTPETRAKMSKSQKGRPSPMKGRHHSPETKLKLSKALRGRIITQEHRTKISSSLKKWRSAQNSSLQSTGPCSFRSENG